MARRVGYDKLPPWRCKITVSHVYGNALLALGPQAVGQIRQVNLTGASYVSRALESFELVFHQALGIIKQPPDQRGLPVINRAAGVKAQDLYRMLGCMTQKIKISKRLKPLGIRDGLVF